MNMQTRIGCLIRLGHTKGSTLSEDAITAYLETLTDAPDELLRSACARLSKAPTYGFPQAADILAMCDTVRREDISKIKALPAYDEQGDRRRWVHCRECQDDPGAWLPSMWCQGSGPGWLQAVNSPLPLSTCGRPQSHAPHSFTERCLCHMAAWRNDKRMTTLAEDTRRQGR